MRPDPGLPMSRAADGDPRATGGALPALCALTLFTSAGLLFWIQPMVAKMILPLLGGAPSVWNTCMVFFQATLLAGYLYADLSTRKLTLWPQVALHLVLLVAAFLCLPPGVRHGWAPPPTSNPAPGLLAMLAVSVGLPAFVLSSTAPMVQKWFSRAGHATSSDPYFLYSASNLGSLLALLGFPVLIEPVLALDRQGRIWTVGFVCLALSLAATAWAVGRSRATAVGAIAQEASGTPGSAAPTAAEKGRWLLLAFVPSSLLLGVTSHLTMDVAAVPLLWVVPFALYLATFVVTFARRPLLPHRAMLAAQPAALLALGAVFFLGDLRPGASFSIHIAAFFVTAMVCHGELAARRPPAAHLTGFYLFLSVGGVLGGVFNALLAPQLFTSVAEYPLIAVAAAFLRPRRAAGRVRWWVDVAVAGSVLLFLRFVPALLEKAEVSFHSYESLRIAAVALAAAVVFAARRHSPVGLGLGVGALVIVSALGATAERTEHRERNFFGSIKVVTSGDTRLFVHGQTFHGAQSLDPARRREPLLYYSRSGPLGEVMSAYAPQLRGKTIAVAGLGAGAIAAYGEQGQEMVFYELDPAVERVARDPRFFTLLADSPASVKVVIGDARLKLAAAPAGAYAMIVLDAFSSDAIPVHLLTREALRLYLSKLAPGGVLVFHLTNAFLDLQPVVHALASDAGLLSAIRWGSPVGGRLGFSSPPTTWVIMARGMVDLVPLIPYPDWYRTEGSADVALWTDSFSNIFRVLKFR